MRLFAILALIAALGVVTACGDDDGGDSGTVGAQEASMEIDPESGPPGTRIEWTLSGCEEESDKSVAMWVGAPTERPGEVVASPGAATESRGTIVVPEGVTEGPLTVGVLCRSSEQQQEPPFEMEELRAQFELTGD
jgi:hypothetical protein